MRIVTSEHKFGGKKMQSSRQERWFCLKYVNPKDKYKNAVIYVLEPY